MRVVLTHTGSEVPDYTKHCVNQIRHTNPKIQIDVLVNYRHIKEFRRKVSNVSKLTILPLEIYTENETLKEFRRISWYKHWGRPFTTYPSPENFVHGTSERLFILNAYIKHNKFNDVWHFENDNLIYGDLSYVANQCSKDKVSVCYMGPSYVVMNAILIPKHEMFNDAMEWYLNELYEGDAGLKAKYKLDMTQEMSVMRFYDKFAYFPSIPEQDKTMGPLGYFMDPASYGQFIAGTNNGHEPGFLDTINHDIAKQHSHKWRGMAFDKLKGPRVIDMNNREIRLFNLHMHNKTRIGEFVTYAKRNDNL